MSDSLKAICHITFDRRSTIRWCNHVLLCLVRRQAELKTTCCYSRFSSSFSMYHISLKIRSTNRLLRAVSLFLQISEGSACACERSVTCVVICVSRAFCSMDQEKRETACSLVYQWITYFFWKPTFENNFWKGKIKQSLFNALSQAVLLK